MNLLIFPSNNIIINDQLILSSHEHAKKIQSNQHRLHWFHPLAQKRTGEQVIGSNLQPSHKKDNKDRNVKPRDTKKAIATEKNAGAAAEVPSWLAWPGGWAWPSWAVTSVMTNRTDTDIITLISKRQADFESISPMTENFKYCLTKRTMVITLMLQSFWPVYGFLYIGLVSHNTSWPLTFSHGWRWQSTECQPSVPLGLPLGRIELGCDSTSYQKSLIVHVKHNLQVQSLCGTVVLSPPIGGSRK